MDSHDAADPESRLSRILQLAKRSTILGAGKVDPNINHNVIARDEWWRPIWDDETRSWYETGTGRST
jgi:hypothetical protein